MRQLSYEDFAPVLLTRLRVDEPLSLGRSTGLYDDLGLDSVQALEMIVIIETMAGVLVPPAEIPDLWVLEDAFKYYLACLAVARIDP